MNNKAVSSKPEVMYGKPVLAGTRIPVEMNFVADESVGQPIVDYLRKNNYL